MTVAHIEVPEAKIAALCRRNGIPSPIKATSMCSSSSSRTSQCGSSAWPIIQNELSRILDGRAIDLRTPMDLSRHFREEVVRNA
jgi:hypothetical protein